MTAITKVFIASNVIQDIEKFMILTTSLLSSVCRYHFAMRTEVTIGLVVVPTV